MSYRAISQEDQTPTTKKRDINVLSIFIFLFSPVKIHDHPTYQTWYGRNLRAVLCVNSLVCMQSLTRLKLRLFQCPVFGFLPSSGPFKKCLL